MAAIITDDFRRNSATFLINDIIDKNAGSTDDSPEVDLGGFEYFIGIGKSDPWDTQTISGTVINEDNQSFSTPLPNGSVSETEEVTDNLIGAVAIKGTNAVHVIPKINWVANRRFKRWNKNDPDMFNVSTSISGNTEYPCYAVYSDKVYICLDNDSNDSYGTNGSYVAGASTVPPTGSGTDDGRKPVSNSGSDDYIWVYVADLVTASEFNTDQFIEVQKVKSGTGTPANKSGGIVYGFEIVNPGAGLTNAATAGDFQLVISDSTHKDPKILDCTATITSGAITGFVSAALNSVDNMISNKGVLRASVRSISSVDATTAPEIRPLISPVDGFGNNPVNDLPAFYAGLAVDFNGDVEGEIPTNVKYRQISLIRQPTRNAADDSPSPTGDGDYSLQEVLSGLRRLTVNSSTGLDAISTGDIIRETTVDGTYDNSSGVVDGQSDYTKAKAFVDYVDVTNKHIYFHQNSSANVNHNDFTIGDGTNTKIIIAKAGGSDSAEYAYTADSNVTPELTPRTGEVLFLENRKPIQRAAAQEEEIKLVIQF